MDRYGIVWNIQNQLCSWFFWAFSPCSNVSIFTTACVTVDRPRRCTALLTSHSSCLGPSPLLDQMDSRGDLTKSPISKWNLSDITWYHIYIYIYQWYLLKNIWQNHLLVFLHISKRQYWSHGFCRCFKILQLTWFVNHGFCSVMRFKRFISHPKSAENCFFFRKSPAFDTRQNLTSTDFHIEMAENPSVNQPFTNVIMNCTTKRAPTKKWTAQLCNEASAKSRCKIPPSSRCCVTNVCGPSYLAG